MLNPIAVGIITIWILTGAIWVVTLKNLLRAALSLGLVLVGVAALFILLQAEFIAFVQILVYVGAVLVLTVFAIMLTANLQGLKAAVAIRKRLPAAIACIALFCVLVSATEGLLLPSIDTATPVSLTSLSQHLIKTLILPFEVITLVLIAAMVGAVAISSRKKGKY